MTDKEFLNWIADRLVHVYGESPNTDFIHKLRELAQRTWVGLTDQEITDTLLGYRLIDALDIYRAIESKLKEKNTK